MGDKVKFASSLRLTAAYRGLNKLDQAVKMNEEDKISMRVAAEACNVKVGKIERAIKAKKEGRNIGVNGRPTLLSIKEELELVKLIAEAESKQEHLTLEQVQMKVCVVIFILNIFYFISHTHFFLLGPRYVQKYFW
jgi:hypothetical protein